jgi:hypothetical protein
MSTRLALPMSCTGPERPIAHLAGFAEILQVDEYGGYRTFADTSDTTLASSITQ